MMKIQCPECKKIYQTDESEIPEKGRYAKCKCGNRFFVEKQGNPRKNKQFAVRTEQAQGIVQAGNINHLTQNYNVNQNGVNHEEMRKSYLNRLLCDAGILFLEGIDPKAAGCEKESRLNLAAVYTDLLTQSAVQAGEQENFPKEMTEKRRVSALEVINQQQHVVLLGDPGSGKSTFVNFVTLCLAGELLGHPVANLALLTRPLSTDKENEKKEPQSWKHDRIIPVRVILRDFAAGGSDGKQGSAASLWQFVENDLKRSALGDFAPYLKQELHKKGGLLMLDGLDEVPEADNHRIRIREAAEDFIKVFHKCRVLVTSRTYAYQKQDWRIPGLYESVLAPFSDAQIREFTERWYAHIAELKRINPKEAQGRAELLKGAIFKSRRLRELAERPLLLTLMASLHSWRGGSLPEKREELYADTVDLLLDWWERPKVVIDENGNTVMTQHGLMEWLKTDRDRIRRMLNQLAYEAHEKQPELTGTADIAEKELVHGLWELRANPKADMRELMGYLSNRAGLLLPRGVKIYSFPHRTFQEYLSACHLTDLDFPDQVAELCRNEPNRWREVCLLAGAKAARGSSAAIWNLAEALCYRNPDDPEISEADIWGAHIAGQALAETAILDNVSPRNQAKLGRIRQWLIRIMEKNLLPATERAMAGNNLAKLGDIRHGVMTVKKMEFCFVPPGPFLMGDNGNNSLNYDYWISRYPVTNAQFDEFVKAGGYKEGRYWKEAEKEGLWSKTGFKGNFENQFRNKPYDFGYPFNLSNHPVVGVSWYEAIAFVRWLTHISQDRFGYESVFRLPAEAEWEKAAKGGLQIPENPIIRQLTEHDRPSFRLRNNPGPNRDYPWGNSPEDDKTLTDKMNYSDTGIGETSSVGCFSKGASPCGCEEMSGNVWEWCSDLWSSAGSDRVIRGGCFFGDARGCRSACRGYGHPGLRDFDLGFRVLREAP